MGITSMQLDSTIRDEVAEIAEKDYSGVPLGEAVRRLVKEHKINRIIRAYEELQADPAEWAEYQRELDMWDVTTGDGLPDATDEYPNLGR